MLNIAEFARRFPHRTAEHVAQLYALYLSLNTRTK